MFSKSFKLSLVLMLAASSLTACGLIQSGENSDTSIFAFGDNGGHEADLAVIAYTQGNFEEADTHVRESLHDNKKNAQALLVGALLSEKTNRPNRARQFYEEILEYNGNEVSVLGSSTPQPEKITDIARKRLRQLNLQQNKLIVEDKQGNKVFNISNEASVLNGTQAIRNALNGCKQCQGNNSTREAVETLFDDGEKNTIARFIILKDLAENDLITKEEFLRGRQSNIGGLLPLTHTPASAQVVKPVPSSRIIMDRINALKSAVEDRAITPKEFSAERNLIIEAILPSNPTERLKRKIPAKEIIPAAKDLRKLEVIYDLGLITSDEKDKERAAIEQALGFRSAPTTETNNLLTPTTAQPQMLSVQSLPQEHITSENNQESDFQTTQEQPNKQTITSNRPTEETQPLIPNVSSPFNN